MKVLVTWDADAYQEYQQLKKATKDGKSSRNKPTYRQLLTSIDAAVRHLKMDPFFGDLIPRKYLLKNTVQRYGTDKIFRVPLVGHWRMLYTVVGDETQIIALILEYLDHKTYNKRFGYRKK